MIKQTNRGFTLIELLVVISIIGLLSSVVMSSVNSARKKADNTQRNQIAEEYRKALMLSYDASGGVYPDTGTAVAYCLGDYPTLGAYNDNGVCGYSYSSSNENATINNALVTYIKGLPTIKIVQFGFGGFTFKGPIYICNSAPCKSVSITWYLQGTGQRCIRGVTPSDFIGATQCTLSMN